MKVFIVISALICVAYGQKCGQCDSANTRIEKTSCKLFCYLDVDSDGLITKENFVQVFNNWNGGNDVPKSIFVPEFINVIDFCDTEANNIFDIFASFGDSNPNLIEKVDMETMFEIFELITGKDRVTREEFSELYGPLYDLVADPNCS